MLKPLPQRRARQRFSGLLQHAVPSTALLAPRALGLRVPFVFDVAYPDEGGLLVVAQHWRGGGPGLYGDLWVDRPPLLLLFWKRQPGGSGVAPQRVSWPSQDGQGGCWVAIGVLVGRR